MKFKKKSGQSLEIILEADLTALGNGLNVGERGKIKDNSTVSGSGY